MRFPALSLAVAGALLYGRAEAKTCPKAKNFIYVVPDGYGVASQTMARDYQSIVNGEGSTARPNSAAIGVDTMLIGTVRTQASDNLVTDSAASATAFGCGIKTYNGAIAVDDDGLPVGSILEAAHIAGFKTGLVVTSRITHATPACYSAHVLNRDSETEIAAQQIGYTHPLGSVTDILMGGGRGMFLPSDDGGSRGDGVNLIDWAKEEGWTYAADKSDFDDAMEDGKLPLPFLGLFGSSHMSYELDRNPEEEPSLLQMVETALATLGDASADSKEGYFIMIEASRIDHAGHANDVAGHVHDTLMYNEVMAYLKDFISDHPDTQLMSAADHECGGLTLEDNYDPNVLAQAQYTSEYLAPLFDEYDGDDAAGYLKDTLLPMYGLTTATDEDIESFLSIYEADGATSMATAIVLAFALEAGVNWSTGGHTAADIMLYGFADGQERQNAMVRFTGGNRDNTHLPTYIEKVLGLNMSDATAALREGGSDWVEKRDMLDKIKREANIAARAHNHGHSH